MEDLLLGIDMGTTGAKCVLITSGGAVLSQAYESYSVDRPAPYCAEQDAEDWWNALVLIVRRCTAGQDMKRIRALSLSVQGGTMILADSAGRPLAPARSWLDSRAVEEAKLVRERFGDEYFFQKTGWKIYSSYNCMQILHIKRNDPALFGQTRYFLSLPDFLHLRLTGRACVDHNSSGITQLMNVKTRAWDPEVLQMLEIGEERLPELIAPGDRVGLLTQKAADELGLGRDVWVVAGGHDQYCAALGAGAVAAGDVLISCGTAWVLLGITDQPVHDPAMNFALGNHVASPGVWGQFGSLRNGGVCLEWLRKSFAGIPGELSSVMDYPLINRLVESCAPGAEGLLFFPHFDGSNIPTWNHASKGGFLGLEMKHGLPHFFRAVMEGVSLEMRWVWETYKTLDPGPHRIRILGGAAKSPVWTQILTDVLDEPVEVPAVADSACIGAAILAGVGAGLFTNAEAGFRAMQVQSKRIEPVAANAALYNKQFDRYKRCFEPLKQAYSILGEGTESCP